MPAGRQARPGCLGVRLSSWGCVWRQRAIRLNFFWLREAFPRLHRPWPPLRTQKAWASALPTHWWNILRGTSCGVLMALACHPVIAGAPSPLRPRSNPARQPRQRGLELVPWGARRGAWRSLTAVLAQPRHSCRVKSCQESGHLCLTGPPPVLLSISCPCGDASLMQNRDTATVSSCATDRYLGQTTASTTLNGNLGMRLRLLPSPGPPIIGAQPTGPLSIYTGSRARAGLAHALSSIHRPRRLELVCHPG